MVNDLIENILRREGGYVNNPNDKGGPTNYGITLSTLKGLGALGDLDGDGDVDENDVKIMTIDQARVFYLDMYVTPFNSYSQWPALHDLLVDSGVQHGVERVKGWLDELRTGDPNVLYKRIFKKRMIFYGEIITKRPQNAVFAAGWMNRLSEFAR